jgi:hypothetical protein
MWSFGIQINVPAEITKWARGYDGKADIEFDAELEGKGEPKVPGAEEGSEVVDVEASVEEDAVSA